MSQYAVRNGMRKYVFGWDQPLMSFFLQVHNLALPEDDQITHRFGGDAETQMYEVEQLVQVASEHDFDIPYRVQMDLFEDKDNGR